jgi:Zn-dependent peptidase ImmA (M78 family)
MKVMDKKPSVSHRVSRHGFSCVARSPTAHVQHKQISQILRNNTIQAKLTIGEPNDKYEQEADRVADEVMRMPEPNVQQQQEPEEEEEEAEPEREEEAIQTKLFNNKPTPVTTGLQNRIQSLKGGGQPLPGSERTFFEPRFGTDFSHVRIYNDPIAANVARSINARAFTHGRDVVFGNGEYTPGTSPGRRLLAHELTHVVQQDNGSMIRRTPEERAALEARLSAKIAERERLRRRMEASQDRFAAGVLRERSDEAYQRTRERLRSQAQSALQRTMLQRTLGHLQRAITVTLTENNTYVLRTNIELSFAALSGDAAAQQAVIQIPRIAQTLRDAWRVDMQQGRYAGRRFQLQPVITHRPSTQTRRQDALQIIVRGNDSDPSSGDFLTGEISLANAHLQSNRIIVVAHELNHLFGDFDTYLIEITPTEELPAGRRRRHAVGRSDASGRSDLLGMVDPVVLQRWLQAGEITQAEYDRQTTAPRIWQEDADNILYALGITPVPENERPMPSPESADYIEEANRRLEAQRQAAQQRLDRVRRRRTRSVESIEWVQMAERAMQLDAEIADLRRRISEL